MKARFCVELANTMLVASEKINNVDEGVQVLDDLNNRGRRVRGIEGMVAGIKLLELKGGRSSTACFMLDHWINDSDYGHIKEPW